MKNKRIVLVRHGNEPADDRATTWFHRRGFYIEDRRPFRGDQLGEIDDSLAGTVIYGGKYNVFDAAQHAFLNEEYRWISECLVNDIPLLGICQGAQQLAFYLGAKVGEPELEQNEYGYYKVSPAPGAGDFLTDPLHFAQAHFHTFDLPADATLLASSELFRNQAFKVGEHAYGFQFHAEQTIESFRRWQKSGWFRWDRPGTQNLQLQTELMMAHDLAQAKWFYAFMDKLFGKSNPQSQSPSPVAEPSRRAQS